MIDSSMIATILSSAGAGTAIIVVLILTGILHTRADMQRVEREAEDWKTAYQGERNARDTERAANNELRAAALAQSQRADASVEAAKLARELLEDLRRRTNAST